jgi:hypothetical protein
VSVSARRRRPARGRPAAETAETAGTAGTGPEPRPNDDPETLRREAEAQVEEHAGALRAYRLPLSAEPAFVFRP